MIKSQYLTKFCFNLDKGLKDTKLSFYSFDLRNSIIIISDVMDVIW